MLSKLDMNEEGALVETVAKANAERVVPLPFLKWAGGKRKLAAQILDLAPRRNYAHYIEPFLGGGAVFFEAWARGTSNRFSLSDINEDLISTYVSVASDYDRLSYCLRIIESEHNGMTSGHATLYESIRAQYNSTKQQKQSAEPVTDELDWDRARRDAQFIYLNKAGFNGLHRVNKSGLFNVPFSKRTKISLYDKDNLSRCSAALSCAKIRHTPLGFEQTLAEVVIAPMDTLIYCDPPYVPASASSSFTGYAADGFTEHDQISLRDWATLCRERGSDIILSNSDMPVVRDLYKDFELHSIQVARPINRDGAKRGKVGELIIVGKGSK